MEKGQICTITIGDISNEGQGIGKAEGMAIFAPGLIIGDVAEVELTKVKKNYAFARVVEVKEPSPYTVPVECEYFGRCGGCTFQGMSYDAQLALKEKQIRDKLVRIAGIENPKLNPIVPMENPYHYRNKAQFPISTGGIITRKGGIVENLAEPSIGFYKAKSHEVVDCSSCMLQSDPAMAAAEALRKFMLEDNITAFDPKWEKGLMRHLVVKTAMNTGEVMVILVVNGKAIPNGEKLVEMLDEAIYALPPSAKGVEYNLESVIINVKKKNTAEILGDECIPMAGKPTILEEIGDLKFEISPLAFYQVNPIQTEKLYAKAMEYADIKGKETVLDLYCGVGTIGLHCAKEMCDISMAKHGFVDYENIGQVIGIESVKGAVIDANRNSVINNIVNARFICGRAEEELSRVLSGYTDKDEFVIPPAKPDIVILDPPRDGCATELLDAVAAAAPKRIVYVSCDPATLARDIKILMEKGFAFVEGTPVDMFPQTRHVECVVGLQRVEK